MRQRHCALAALYVCALLGWNQLCATLSQTSDLVAKQAAHCGPYGLRHSQISFLLPKD